MTMTMAMTITITMTMTITITITINPLLHTYKSLDAKQLYFHVHQ